MGGFDDERALRGHRRGSSRTVRGASLNERWRRCFGRFRVNEASVNQCSKGCLSRYVYETTTVSHWSKGRELTKMLSSSRKTRLDRFFNNVWAFTVAYH